jgi:hypothetical protein
MIQIKKPRKKIQHQYFKEELTLLSEELKDKFVSFTMNLEETIFEFTSELSSEALNLFEQAYLTHNPEKVVIEEVIEKRILLSMDLGARMMAKFGAENKAMTARGELSTNDLFTLSFVLKDLQLLVISGSLEMAAFAWSTLPVMDGLSIERKQKYARLLAAYLEQVRLAYPLPGEGS